MIRDIVAVVGSVVVVCGLSVALFGWFTLSLRRFYGVVARDVLTRWDSQLAELSDFEREHERTHPPVEVLEAVLALPSRRPRRFQLS
jgi:hypothetical protein